MLDILYENIGGRIKTLAKAFFVIDVVVSIIAGLVLFFMGATEPEYFGYLILLAPVATVVGCVAAFLMSCPMYAFGELVETSAKNEKNTAQMLELMKEKDKKSAPTTPTAANTQTSSVQNSDPQPERQPTVPKADSRGKNAVAEAVSDEKIRCSECGFEQPKNRKLCWHCGARFEEAPTIV